MFKCKLKKVLGFTLIELLVVIAIIAILAAMLMPALERAREAAVASKCMSRQKQIGKAFQMYANDYNGMFPAGYRRGRSGWTEQTDAYLGAPEPENPGGGYKGAAMVTSTVFSCPGYTVVGDPEWWNADPKDPGQLPEAQDGEWDSTLSVYGIRWTSKNGSDENPDDQHNVMDPDDENWYRAGMHDGDKWGFHMKPSRIADSSSYMMLTDTVSYGFGKDGMVQYFHWRAKEENNAPIHMRHNRQANSLLADGHVEAVGRSRFIELNKPYYKDPYNMTDSWWVAYGPGPNPEKESINLANE